MRCGVVWLCCAMVCYYDRAWPIYERLAQVEELYKITSIDKWFLYKLKRIVDVDKLIEVTLGIRSRERVRYVCCVLLVKCAVVAIFLCWTLRLSLLHLIAMQPTRLVACSSSHNVAGKHS